jgi:uncharacterized protein (DUF2141 family)
MTLFKYCAATAVFMTSLLSSAQAAEVVVVVDGVEPGRGSVAVAFCDKGPLEECRQYSGDTKASAETLGFRFDNVPAGKYAFVATQDINESGDNERNMLGMPKEPFAVGAPETRLVPPPTHETIATEVIEGSRNVIRLTLRTVTGTRKKEGVPTRAVEDVELIFVDDVDAPASGSAVKQSKPRLQ